MLTHEGRFTVAPKELHLTQSAVSHAIKALEEDVGCRLLNRAGRKILLTQAGEQFLVRAELEALGRRKLKRKWGLLHWKGRPMGWAENTFVRLPQSGASQFAARNGWWSPV